MTKLRGIRYSLILLKNINFLLVQAKHRVIRNTKFPSSELLDLHPSLWRDSSHYLLSDAPRDTGVVGF